MMSATATGAMPYSNTAARKAVLIVLLFIAALSPRTDGVPLTAVTVIHLAVITLYGVLTKSGCAFTLPIETGSLRKAAFSQDAFYT